MTTAIQFQFEGRLFGLSATGALVVMDPATGNTYQLTPAASEHVDLTATVADLNTISSAGNAAAIGAVSGTGVTCTIARYGKFFSLDFTFTAVSVPHTDSGAGGSFGTLKVFDFVEGAVLILASRSNITLTADNVLDNGTTLAGVYGFGSVAATAHDGSLSGTEVNFQAASGTLTATAHVLTSTDLLKPVGTAVDGTATAADIIFNESCSAATSVANGTIVLAGTTTLIGVFIGDD